MIRQAGRAVFTLAVLAVAALAAGAQETTPPKSLAEMAATANTKKADHPTVVWNDDSPASQKPLIPNVWEGDCDNTDEILATIKQYRQTHTRAETEQVVHAWYEKHALMLDRAAEENRRIIRSRQDHSESPYDYGYMKPGDYQQYYEKQLAASRSAYDDQWRYEQNYQVVYRTETVFGKVKYGIRRMGMDFDWFKLRCGIDYCTY
jgi:hypothetical protein